MRRLRVQERSEPIGCIYSMEWALADENKKKKWGEKIRRSVGRAALRERSPCERSRVDRKEKVFPRWKRKSKIEAAWERCRGRARNGRCCNCRACRRALAPANGGADGMGGAFGARGRAQACRFRPRAAHRGRWRQRWRAGKRDTRRLVRRRSDRCAQSAPRCRGSERFSPPIAAAERGEESKPRPLDDGGCEVLRTCIGAKIGRNGQRCKSEGKKREIDGVFALQDAVGRTDRGRCRGALDRARGLARNRCGKSRKSGAFLAQCPHFLSSLCVAFAMEATMGCRSRLLRVRSEGEGRGFCRMGCWAAPAAHGGGEADGNCCAVTTKMRRGDWLGRGGTKNGSDSLVTIRAIEGIGRPR